MNELSIFTGAGGGVWASKLLGHRMVGYVEWEPSCQQILKARIQDGSFDNAPIFTDIRTFISEGYADSYKGLVDLISGGFPCQPFSSAGKQAQDDDPRNMWPSTLRAICIIRPRYVFLENVANLISLRYARTIFGELAKAGYSFKWTVLGLGALGGKSVRKRLWILGWDNSVNVQGLSFQKRVGFKKYIWSTEPSGDLSNASTSWLMAEGYGDREVDEVPNWEYRIKALGNAQSPTVAATAFRLLSEGLS